MMTHKLILIFLSPYSVAYGAIVCDAPVPGGEADLSESQLAYIQQSSNVKNVDLAYRDYALNTTAIVQKYSGVPFRRQWFYIWPCSSTLVQFITHKKFRALQVSVDVNKDGSNKLICGTFSPGDGNQIFGITQEGIIYNPKHDGIALLMTGDTPVNESAPVFVSSSSISDGVTKSSRLWRIIPANPKAQPPLFYPLAPPITESSTTTAKSHTIEETPSNLQRTSTLLGTTLENMTVTSKKSITKLLLVKNATTVVSGNISMTHNVINSTRIATDKPTTRSGTKPNAKNFLQMLVEPIVNPVLNVLRG